MKLSLFNWAPSVRWHLFTILMSETVFITWVLTVRWHLMNVWKCIYSIGLSTFNDTYPLYKYLKLTLFNWAQSVQRHLFTILMSETFFTQLGSVLSMTSYYTKLSLFSWAPSVRCHLINILNSLYSIGPRLLDGTYPLYYDWNCLYSIGLRLIDGNYPLY